MIVKKISKITDALGFNSEVKQGYIQGGGAALPDIDIDYASDRREDVRKYVESRYNTNGQQRVFSCGTFTTLKIKAALSDVARAHKVQTHIVKYITAIIDDDAMDFTDFFKLAYKNKKVRAFIETYPYVIEDMRALMGQPRSSSIHASAIIPVPSKKDGVEAECFDYVPIKKVDGMLISELDGYSCDEIGMLKLDCLNTVELTKLSAMFKLVKENYGDDLSLEEIEQNRLHDDGAYSIFRQGYTQNIFQFGSDGMTKLTMDIAPTDINDIIALNALYRPATIELGAPAAYARYKHGEAEPVYLWGTYEALKKTYGLLIYQESLSKIAHEIGGFSLSEAVALVKLISKKKVDKIKAMKEKFIEGALSKGCPEDDANSIWEMFEASGTYLFNYSHATAYGLLAYVGAYVKFTYPTVFYTVALQYAKDDDRVKAIMLEMECASNCKIVPPDINVSGKEFETDYDKNYIYWSLSRIKHVGGAATTLIIEEREANGPFKGIEDFIERIQARAGEIKDEAKESDQKFTNPVNSRTVKHLIYAGCFDIVEGVHIIQDRMKVLEKASNYFKTIINDKEIPEDLRDKQYKWAQLQIMVSTLGSVDYKRIYEDSDAKKLIKGASYVSFKDLSECNEGSKVIVCSTIADVIDSSYTDKMTGEKKRFGKVVLQQDNETIELVIWNDAWCNMDRLFMENIGKIVVAVCYVKYNPRSGSTNLSCSSKSFIKILND